MPDQKEDPHREVLSQLTTAALCLRAAKPIAEGLPNHGNLYQELADALGHLEQAQQLIATAMTALTGELERRNNRHISYDFPPA